MLTLFKTKKKPLANTLNMYGYWCWLYFGIDIGIDIGIGVGIVVGVGICIGICVGVGTCIGVGIAGISQHVASCSI